MVILFLNSNILSNMDNLDNPEIILYNNLTDILKDKDLVGKTLKIIIEYCNSYYNNEKKINKSLFFEDAIRRLGL